MRIYLDDERNPTTNISWIIVRNYNELVELINNSQELVSEISFDHDLGEDKTGLDCLRFIIEIDMNNGYDLLSKDFKYNFHTANPVGRDNMKGLMESYLKYKGENYVRNVDRLN